MRILRAAEQIDGGRVAADEITDENIAQDMPNDIFRFFQHLNSWGFTYPEDAGQPGTDDDFDEALYDFYEGNSHDFEFAMNYIKSRWSTLKRFEPRYASKIANWVDAGDYLSYNLKGTDPGWSVQLIRGFDGFTPRVITPDGRSFDGQVESEEEFAKEDAIALYIETRSKHGSKRTASVKTASAWQWDDDLNGYIAANDVKTNDGFRCECGRKVASPGMASCKCGKIWNSYTIASTNKNLFVCREVPRRDVLLARRESK